FKRKIPGGLHPHFGSSYWYLHRSCLQWVHDYLINHPEYVKFFRWAHIPDENFFQTLLMNSELEPSICPRTLTYVDWRPPFPGILTIEDLPRLHESDCLMARKFDSTVDAEIMNQLDQDARLADRASAECSQPFAEELHLSLPP
ncbi:MAG: beta-1,6-N-acetylglucosaminyltransferase, partial [Verrucomicrobiota bacterium]